MQTPLVEIQQALNLLAFVGCSFQPVSLLNPAALGGCAAHAALAPIGEDNISFAFSHQLKALLLDLGVNRTTNFIVLSIETVYSFVTTRIIIV